MKLFFKILKIVCSLLFLIFILGISYFALIAPKEQRFKMAEHMQGSLFSQSMFEILKYQYPEYSNAYFEQSVAFNKYGSYAKGFELLNQAVALNPEFHLGYRGYMKLRFLRDFEGALWDFARLDSLTPNVVDAPWGENIDFLRGECYFGQKDFPRAIKCFNRSVKNQKEDWADPQTFVYLGLCEYELGNFEKAVLEFKRALAQSANVCEAHFGLAKTYEKSGKIELAQEHLKKAEESITYKREDAYKEYLNEIYSWEIIDFKQQLIK